MEASFDVATFYIVFIFCSLLSAFLMLAALLGYILSFKKRQFAIAALATLILLLAAGSLILNPFLNYWIFMGTNYESLMSMKREIERTELTDMSRQELVSRFGSPKRVRRTDDYERWIYEPGPWYAYMQLDYIVFRVKDGQVESFYVDYF